MLTWEDAFQGLFRDLFLEKLLSSTKRRRSAEEYILKPGESVTLFSQNSEILKAYV